MSCKYDHVRKTEKRANFGRKRGRKTVNETAEMKSIRLQSIAADFTKCWAKYMADGKGEAFIKTSSAILSQTQKKDGASIAQSVLSSFIVPENSGGDLKVNEYNGTKVKPNVKVVLGCLSAIRSLQGVDGDGSTKDCLHSVLIGAGGVAKTMVASPRTAEEEVSKVHVHFVLAT